MNRTPGAWNVNVIEERRFDVYTGIPTDRINIWIEDEGHKSIAIVIKKDEEGKGNAALISAAPDLLAAAIQAITIPLIFLDQIQDIKLRQEVADAYNMLALAINKAEGRLK